MNKKIPQDDTAKFLAMATSARPAGRNGLCQCGCGQEAPVAAKTSRRNHSRRGEGRRYIKDHYGKAIRLLRLPFEEYRFWDQINLVGHCWEWVGNSKAAGYGRFKKTDGTNILAHRHSFLLANGHLPNDLCVLHRCDNPLCVRPDHLFVGTNKDNVDDRVAKGRGPDFSGSNNPRSRITEEDVASIRAKHGRGASTKELARTYGLTRCSIIDIVSRRTWRHI